MNLFSEFMPAAAEASQQGYSYSSAPGHRWQDGQSCPSASVTSTCGYDQCITAI